MKFKYDPHRTKNSLRKGITADINGTFTLRVHPTAINAPLSGRQRYTGQLSLLRNGQTLTSFPVKEYDSIQDAAEDMVAETETIMRAYQKKLTDTVDIIQTTRRFLPEETLHPNQYPLPSQSEHPTEYITLLSKDEIETLLQALQTHQADTSGGTFEHIINWLTSCQHQLAANNWDIIDTILPASAASDIQFLTNILQMEDKNIPSMLQMTEQLMHEDQWKQITCKNKRTKP